MNSNCKYCGEEASVIAEIKMGGVERNLCTDCFISVTLDCTEFDKVSDHRMCLEMIKALYPEDFC